MQADQVVVWRKVKDAVATAALWLLIGWGSAAYYYRSVPMAPTCPAAAAPVPAPPAPAPPPAPVAPSAPVHAGHFTISYVEPRYPSPASAAVRQQLAAVTWSDLDATYRSYTEGQSQLATLGFDRYFKPADLPILFLQEDGPTGAPIIDQMKAPASAESVVSWVKGFRGL